MKIADKTCNLYLYIDLPVNPKIILKTLQIMSNLISSQLPSETNTLSLLLETPMYKQKDGTPYVKQPMKALELMLIRLNSDWNN